MALQIFNTMSRRRELFEPLEKGRVGLYTCGPTVYDYAHIGNFRAYVFEDLLSRYLRFLGFEVTHVMNLTDVDDKTIRAARREGLPLKTYTQRYIEAFFEDLDTLNIRQAEKYPAATEHIPEMLALIKLLIAKGFAYVSDDGSVYYNIARFKPYGRLSRIDLSGLKPGARVAQDEYGKEHVADFALWKAWDDEDGDVGWEAPWGRGRPGWHIECSAMSMKHLGESFDIHCGGIDNMFPHHEDEIAQSEAATGRTFVRCWMHNAHLIVDGQKMSKSLGNFFTLRDLLRRGYTGREVRYELLATHYRQTLNFSFQGLDAAKAALRRVDEFSARLRECAAAPASEGGGPPAWVEEGRRVFCGALDDDLNVSGALAGLFDMVHAGNKAMNEGRVTPGGARAALRTLEELDCVMGCLNPPAQKAEQAIEELVQAREEARRKRDWKEADRLRLELSHRGWEVKDTPTGPKVMKS